MEKTSKKPVSKRRTAKIKVVRKPAPHKRQNILLKSTLTDKQEKETVEELESYKIVVDDVHALVRLVRKESEYVPRYEIKRLRVNIGTEAVLNSIKEELMTIVELSAKEFVDPNATESVKKRFTDKALILINKYLPRTSETDRKSFAGSLIHEMIGLGELELLLGDPNLEEIVVNSAQDPVWVFHKKHGWVKTNLVLKTEEQIYNYASSIGRRIGRQITNLHPLMDAHLTSGDRVNATIFPISTKGNTLTIRKFSRSPWTIIHFIDPSLKTLTSEVAALLWLAVQYELNVMVGGGTASGKTSFLNTLMPFIPPNQRIISIEDTREINLPKFLQWVPFSSREESAEGKGAVTMLDLLINSLRMRPDRIVIGEIRRAKEAEVMFEAIRTGHSAYASFHADKAEELYKRFINPPMSLPPSVLSALHLIVVQYRDRRRGLRRTLEVAELIPGDTDNRLNVIYRWDPRTDEMKKVGRLIRIANELNLYTGMSEDELEKDVRDKAIILDWMVRHKVNTVDTVGKIIADYYKDQNRIVRLAKKNKDPKIILGTLSEELKK